MWGEANIGLLFYHLACDEWTEVVRQLVCGRMAAIGQPIYQRGAVIGQPIFTLRGGAKSIGTW